MDLFEEHSRGFVSNWIAGIGVTAKGTVLAYCEAGKFSGADWGEIEVHLRRSTDDGRTFDAPRQIAHDRAGVAAAIAPASVGAAGMLVPGSNRPNGFAAGPGRTNVCSPACMRLLAPEIPFDE